MEEIGRNQKCYFVDLPIYLPILRRTILGAQVENTQAPTFFFFLLYFPYKLNRKKKCYSPTYFFFVNFHRPTFYSNQINLKFCGDVKCHPMKFSITSPFSIISKIFQLNNSKIDKDVARERSNVDEQYNNIMYHLFLSHNCKSH